MSQYIAKKVILDIKKECSNRTCGCYTEQGYLIKYANRNVDAVLFVCEECFQNKYRSQCIIQDFPISHKKNHPERTTKGDHPTLRCVIKAFNKMIRVVKYASGCLLIILTIWVGILSGEYNFRKTDDLKLYSSTRITENLSERIDKVTEQIQYIFTEERSPQ